MTKLLSYFNYHKQFTKRILGFYIIGFIIFSCICFSCSSPVDLPGFDKKAWQGDVRSCKNIRPRLAFILKKHKNRLIGLNHTEVLSLLGKPESNSLEKSGERVYSYFIQPGRQCEYNNMEGTGNKIFIRFDALDRVYKIRFEKEI